MFAQKHACTSEHVYVFSICVYLTFAPGTTHIYVRTSVRFLYFCTCLALNAASIGVQSVYDDHICNFSAPTKVDVIANGKKLSRKQIKSDAHWRREIQ